MQLLLSFIVSHTPHLIGNLDHFRIFFLNADDFAYPLKIHRIPHTAHQAPSLIELVFLDVILPDISGDIPQIGMKSAFEIIFALFYLLFLLLLQIPLESFFPVVHHPLPNFLIRISPFIAELPLIKRPVETITFMFAGNLLQ